MLLNVGIMGIQEEKQAADQVCRTLALGCGRSSTSPARSACCLELILDQPNHVAQRVVGPLKICAAYAHKPRIGRWGQVELRATKHRKQVPCYGHMVLMQNFRKGSKRGSYTLRGV